MTSSTLIPELDAERIRRWCAGRVPPHARHQVFVEAQIEGHTVDVVERRALWDREDAPESEWAASPVARFRYVTGRKVWQLYWRDRNLKWHLYQPLPESSFVQHLIDEVDHGGNPIFWG